MGRTGECRKRVCSTHICVVHIHGGCACRACCVLGIVIHTQAYRLAEHRITQIPSLANAHAPGCQWQWVNLSCVRTSDFSNRFDVLPAQWQTRSGIAQANSKHIYTLCSCILTQSTHRFRSPIRYSTEAHVHTTPVYTTLEPSTCTNPKCFPIPSPQPHASSQ